MLTFLLILKSALLLLASLGAISALGLCAQQARRALDLSFSFHDGLAWGVLLIITMSWYLLGWVDLKPVLLGSTAAFAVLGLIGSVKRGLHPSIETIRSDLGYIWIFLFVVVIFGFVSISPYTTGFLVIPTRGNLDVFNYLNAGSLLMKPHQTSVVGLYGKDIASALLELKRDAFGAFSLISFFGVLFSQPPSAFVVVVIGLVAFLISTTVYDYCRNFVMAEKAPALAASLQFLMMPLFQYVLLNFFIGQLLSSWALLRAVLIVIESFKTNTTTVKMIFRLFPYFAIMFLTYISTFLTNLGLVVLVFVFLSFKTGPSKNKFEIAKKIGLVFGPMLMLIGFCFPYRLKIFGQMIQFLSNINAGWSLQYVSPFSMVGLNAGPGVVFAAGKILIWASLIFFSGYLCWLLKKISQKSGWQNPRTQLLVLFAGLWGLYNVAFVYYGADSYNQWKFATFYPMMFSFIFALLFFERFLHAKRAKWMLSFFFVLMGIVTVKQQREAMMKKIPSSYSQLSEINSVGEIQDIIVAPLSPEENMVLTQFIENQKIWFMSYSQPAAILDLKDETIQSPRTAFLAKVGLAYDPQDLILKIGESFLLLKNSEKYMRASR